MKLFIDGSFLYNRRQGAYKYVTSVVPYLSSIPGLEVIVTPSPTGILNELSAPGIKVKRKMQLSASRIPLGPFRKYLSKIRQSFQKASLSREVSKTGRNIFHSYFCGLPPTSDYFYLCTALDMIPEKLG